MGELILKKDGVLIYRRNNGEETDVSDRTFCFLFEPCQLDSDVTLKDVFLLLERDMILYNDLFTHHCREIVEEGLDETSPKDTEDYDEDMLYLELHWEIFFDDGEVSDGNTFPQFHGVGKKEKYALDFSSSKDLIDYPLRLSDTLTIYDDDKIKTYLNPEYTLGNILDGIIHELSWFGSPVERKKQVDSLTKYTLEDKEELRLISTEG